MIWLRRTCTRLNSTPGAATVRRDSTPAKFPSGIASGVLALVNSWHPAAGPAVGHGVIGVAEAVGVREGVRVGPPGVMVRVAVPVTLGVRVGVEV